MNIPQIAHNVLAIFVLPLGIASFLRNYQMFNSFEHFLLLILFLLQENISFSIFQMLKVVVSFLFFLIEMYVSKQEFKSLHPLRYLIGDYKNLCHANVGIGEVTYDYRTIDGEALDSADRTYNLQPNKGKQPTSVLAAKMFWSPCVGFSMEYTETTLMKKLDSCGKCHEWPAVAIYLLSTHKFLSYSSLAYVRCMNWACLGVSAVVLTIGFVMHTYGFPMIISVVNENLGEFPPKAATVIGSINHVQKSLDLILWVIVDLVHMLITLLDILNLTQSRLEDNSRNYSKLFPHRGIFLEVGKFFALYTLVFAWCWFMPSNSQTFGYVMYLFICVIVGLSVRFILLS